MSPILAFSILAVIFAFAQVVAKKTKATLSAAFVIAITLVVLFNIGLLPRDIYEVSTILPIGGLLVGVLVTGMGNMLDFAELKRQWKTVIIAVVGVIFASLVLIFAGGLFIGRDMAMAGTPVFAGGATATVIMTGILNEKGLGDLALFAVLMLAVQNFVGIPIASQLLKRSARKFLHDDAAYALYAGRSAGDTAATVGRKPLALPASLDMPSVSLAKLALVTALAFYVGNFTAQYTGGFLSYIIVALVFGTVFTELGFLESNVLGETQASGFVMFATLMIAFSSLANTSPAQVVSMLVPLLIAQVIGVAGCFAAGILLGKLLRVEWFLAVSMILTCLFGFPTTMLMSNEVAEAVGGDDRQREIIGMYIRPKMITAGFITGIFSIALAGVVSGMF